MSVTKPPCKVDGMECPRRYIGCRAECEAYHAWLAIHGEEVERERAGRNRELEYYQYSAKQIEKHEKYKSRKRRGQK